MNSRVKELTLGTDEALKRLLFQRETSMVEVSDYMIRTRIIGKNKYKNVRHSYQRQANEESVRSQRLVEIILSGDVFNDDARYPIMEFDEKRKSLTIFRNRVKEVNREVPGFTMALNDSLRQFAVGMRIIERSK